MQRNRILGYLVLLSALVLAMIYSASFCSERKFPVIPTPDTVDKFAAERVTMVRHQIEGRGVRDKDVLTAMRSVKRHLFVPQSLQMAAYTDCPLPIGFGQTISQPFIVAYMTETLKLTSKHKVLEIGTGSGYQAAVLAEITDKVFTIEIIPELGESAAERIKKIGYDKVKVKVSDGYYGWKEHAPFDAIIVTASSETIPPPLLEQLAEGGRMIIPVGSQFQVQMLVLLEKKNGKITATNLMPVVFVPFRRKAE